MTLQSYSHEQLTIAKKFISPDAFLYIVLDAISREKKLSVVGFGDGERAVMLYSQGNGKASYLTSEKYLQEYGLKGADLKQIGAELYAASLKADYFCPLISGVSMPDFDCIRICKERKEYVERLFPYAWFYMQRERELFQTSVAIVCRNAANVAFRLQQKYKQFVLPIEYSSYDDKLIAMDIIYKSKCKLILCAVGQSGKLMIVEAANNSGKVILDIGSALINKWQQ